MWGEGHVEPGLCWRLPPKRDDPSNPCIRQQALCCMALFFSLFPPNYFTEAELFIPSSKSEVRLFGALGSPNNDWWPREAELPEPQRQLLCPSVEGQL